MKQFIIVLLSMLLFLSHSAFCMEKSISDYNIGNVRKEVKINIRKCSCNERFDTTEQLEKHVIDKHFNSDIYTCPKCKLEFFNFDTIMEHFPKHTKEVIYSCNSCKIDFSKIEDIRDHCKLHKKYERIFKYFISNEIAINIDSKFPCPICKKFFKKVGFLFRHFDKFHLQHIISEDQSDVPYLIEPPLFYTDEPREAGQYILAPFNPGKDLPISALKQLNVDKIKEIANHPNLRKSKEPNSWSSGTNCLIKSKKIKKDKLLIKSHRILGKRKRSSHNNDDINDSACPVDFIQISSDSETEEI